MANTITLTNTVFNEAFVEVGATTASMTALGLTRNVRLKHDIQQAEAYTPHLKAPWDSFNIRRDWTVTWVNEELTLHNLTLFFALPMANLSPASPNTNALNLNAADELQKAIRVTTADQGGNDRLIDLDKCKISESGEWAQTIEGGEPVQRIETAFKGYVDNTGKFGDITQTQTETLPTGWTGI